MEEEKYISHIEQHHKTEAEDDSARLTGSRVESGMAVCMGSGGCGGGGGEVGEACSLR